MDRNSTNSSTAVRVIPPSDGGWNSPIDDDTSGRQIEGALLRFDNAWSTGKEKTPIANGTRQVALGIKTGWKRWENGKVVEFVSEINGHYPKRDELGHDDQELWEPGPGGEP